MFRILRILIIATVALVLTTPVWGGETSDVQQVRELLYKDIDGHFKGDPEQVLSCYAPGFVGYQASGEGPELWEVGMVGLDALREAKEANVVEIPATWAKHPEWSHDREVLHVHLKDNHAIAWTQQLAVMPDSTARETIVFKWQDVWMVAKIKDEWKITNAIWRVKVEQTVWKWNPE